MKHLFSFLLFFTTRGIAQQPLTLNLQKTYDMAEQNFPLIRQRQLLKNISEINLDELKTGYYPQLNINGQATYQSDVLKFTGNIPGITFPSPAKDQYKLSAELSQLVYDGGLIKQQQELEQLNNDVNQQNLNVQLYQLRDRINQLFFGILYLDEQLKQLELVKQDINLGIKTMEALVNNGVAFKSNLNLLKAELLQADQHGIEMRTSRKGLLDILSLFVNQPLPENTQLEKPVAQIPAMDNNINRPELNLFSAQQKQLQGRLNLYDAGKKPRASLFFQGGYGRPGLNALLNQFKSYYITGVRLSWNLGWLYTHKKEIELLGFAQQSVNVQKDVFLFNTNTQLKQQQTEIEKLQKLIMADKEIIDLRASVKDAAKAQLENGVITSIDYLKEVNEEDKARQDLITHQVQLLQAQVNYQTISGKQ